jgi:alkanesulfonate monooxygenase SsuD/methylene tetrahydromethanopterin reductase-like flavin-dependent oxidoreductase (luciferase family)
VSTATADNGAPIRPFRFGINVKTARPGAEWATVARRLESWGYDVLQMADHYSVSAPQRFPPGEIPGEEHHTLAPLVGLAYAAAVTTTLRLGPHVIANDFRNPGVLAKDIASVDVLSGGRVELGIGAGYLQPDYDNLGIPLDPPGDRVARLAESLTILTDLFEHGVHEPAGTWYSVHDVNGPRARQRPHPPILIGGSGPRMMALAAARADIVGVMARGPLDVAQCVDIVVRGGEQRGFVPEMNVVMMRGKRCTEYALGGSVGEMATFLERQRDALGISYVSFTDVDSTPEHWAPLVERLAGR